MRVHCRLKELIARRNISMADLSRRTGIDEGQLRKLHDGAWKSIKGWQMGRLLDELGCNTLDQLFVALDDDIWAPIRVRREMTIHFGSSSFPEVAGDRSLLQGGALRESIGYWDLRAFFAIGEYVSRLGGVDDLKFRAHPTDMMGQGAVEEVFRDGNHLLLGSPVANPVVEGVVSRAFDVPPNSAVMRERFPYNFVWDAAVHRVSSFGVIAQAGEEMGILSTRTRQLVARRTLVTHESGAAGHDCALIVTHLIRAPREGGARRRAPEPDAGGARERIIIAILGHSGPGTLAGAEAIIDPKCRGELYPAAPAHTRMRVVSATYVRQAPGVRDSRSLTHWKLEPEDA